MAMEFVAKIGRDGRVVIPTQVREALGLQKGDYVVLSIVAYSDSLLGAVREAIGEEKGGKKDEE